MTIREHLNQRKRRIVAIFIASIVLFMVGCFLSSSAETLAIVLCMPSFFVGALTMLVGTYLAFRCPRCGGPWQSLAMQMSKSPFAIDHRIRYCPFCGADVDAKEGSKPVPEGADLLA